MATGWVPDIEDFDGLTQEDWHDYVRSAHKAYDEPSIRDIARNAKKYDKRYALGKTTISETLRGRWPTAQTAYRLGLGIGGPGLAMQFRNGWLAADGKKRMQIHLRNMNHVLERLEHYDGDEGYERLREGERRERRQREQQEQVEREKRRRKYMWAIAVQVIFLIASVLFAIYR
ncbi:hypothetical protein ACFU7X_25460 [Streptomyces chartreusis]|uniref:hypothetical protein n=1 Tax=Streptomyces chartreusis TaxID=1969 RepID=UPI0036A3E179